jgi:hypothetical protein
MGYGEALPGYGAAKGAALGRASEGGGDPHVAMRANLILEEITETSGLDPNSWPHNLAVRIAQMIKASAHRQYNVQNLNHI